MNAYEFGRMLGANMLKQADAPNMLNNMTAARQLQPGQRFVGGQLVSGPGAKPLSVAQQEEVDAANETSSQFNRINAGAGGAGRGGMPVQQQRPVAFPQARPAAPAAQQARPAAPPVAQPKPQMPQRPMQRKLPTLPSGPSSSPTFSGGFE